MALNIKKTTTQTTSASESNTSAPKSFLKKGAAAQQVFDQEEKKAEMATKNTARRFWLENGKEGSITFLDGNLIDGAFENPFAFEHTVAVAGKWQNFICLHEEESCPICEGGGSKYSYVGYFSIIDHREYKDNQGKIQKDKRRLFVAKRGTVKTLLKMAQKRGGLAGCRFDVSRTGDKEASVGNVFDFTEKVSANQLKQQFGEEAVPFDYDEVIGAVYMTSKDLRKLGFGQAGVGSEPPLKDDEDHSDNL